jgi:DNA-binding Lrp family transcriptional regulator
MNLVFVQIRCNPGTTYEVADALALLEVASEIYSISGDFDLLAKIYIPEGEDTGRYINDIIAKLPPIQRTRTTLTFRAF